MTDAQEPVANPLLELFIIFECKLLRTLPFQAHLTACRTAAPAKIGTN